MLPFGEMVGQATPDTCDSHGSGTRYDGRCHIQDMETNNEHGMGCLRMLANGVAVWSS